MYFTKYRVRQKYCFSNGCGIEMVKAKSNKFLILFYHNLNINLNFESSLPEVSMSLQKLMEK